MIAKVGEGPTSGARDLSRTFFFYDANQLQAALERRQDAYQDDFLSDGIIPLSAAFAAQDHGDAQKAIDLFPKAYEIADRGGEDTVGEEHVCDAQKEADRDRTVTQMRGLSTQKEPSVYATAIVPAYSQRNLNAVPSTVAYRVYQYPTKLLDAEDKSRDSYSRYKNDTKTYNFVTPKKRVRGYGRGIHRNSFFFPEVVAETLQSDLRLKYAEHDEVLAKSVVNAQINFLMRLTRRVSDADT